MTAAFAASVTAVVAAAFQEACVWGVAECLVVVRDNTPQRQPDGLRFSTDICRASTDSADRDLFKQHGHGFALKIMYDFFWPVQRTEKLSPQPTLEARYVCATVHRLFSFSACSVMQGAQSKTHTALMRVPQDARKKQRLRVPTEREDRPPCSDENPTTRHTIISERSQAGEQR